MKRIIAFFIIGAFACLPGFLRAQTTTQQRTVAGFNAIRASDGIDIYLTQGNAEGVTVEADTKAIDRVKTEVEGGVLKVYMEKGMGALRDIRTLKVHVNFKQLTGVTASGGSDVYIQNGLTAGKISFEMSGGSDLKGKITADEIQLALSGGSDADVSGKTGVLGIRASGGSDVKAYGLISDKCQVDNGGGSDIYVTVNKELNVNASGGSDVYYKGSASSTQIRASGGSDVKKKE